MLAVTCDDPSTLIKKYFAKNKLTFPVVRDSKGAGSVAALYSVAAYPTTYILDGTGKIVWHSVGSGGNQIRLALKKMEL